MRIARVEPLTRTRAVRGPFDYRLPADYPALDVGALLRVPFGRSRTVGVVVELASESALGSEQLAEPEALLPDAVPADLVALARWMADEYCSTPARALSLVLAPGARRRVRSRTVPGAAARTSNGTPHPAPSRLTRGQREALERVLALLPRH